MDIQHLMSGQLDLAQMATPQPLGFRGPVEQAPAGDKARTALHKAGQEFESYFISYLIKNMRETVRRASWTGKMSRSGTPSTIKR